MKKLFILFTITLLSACVSNPNTSESDLGKQKIRIGKMSSANPFSEILYPGALILYSGGSEYDLLDDGGWLEKHGGYRGLTKVEKLNKNCDKKGSCTIFSVTTEVAAGWEAEVNLKFSENNYLKANGINTSKITKKIYNSDRLRAKNSSTQSAFNVFRQSEKYNEYKDTILARIGDRKGKILLVNELEVINSGNFKLTFNKSVSAEAKIQITKAINAELGSDKTPVKYVWGEGFVEINATKSRPFMNEWQLVKIKL